MNAAVFCHQCSLIQLIALCPQHVIVLLMPSHEIISNDIKRILIINLITYIIRIMHNITLNKMKRKVGSGELIYCLLYHNQESHKCDNTKEAILSHQQNVNQLQ